jgi:EAL domain-containing protein (putative c-di-GMP-specific phosphodiesterase class I)
MAAGKTIAALKPFLAVYLFLLYQPIINLNTGQVCGAEALIRWQHPERGLIAPDIFIPLAEATGAIYFIGLWVLREAVRQIKVWQQKTNSYAPYHLGKCFYDST